MSLEKYYIPGSKTAALISIISISVITYLHLSTPSGFHIIHIIHYYMLYLAVIYTAMKFGFLGGLISAFIITVFYAPDVYLNILNLQHYQIRSLVEILMMYTLGLFAGLYSQRIYLQNKKLKETYEQLEKSIEEKIKMEKEVAKSEKLRVMGQLSAGIAHEIRNPLASLKSASRMLKDGKNSPQILDIMTSEIDRLNAFVERFLQYANFGKIENEKIKVSSFFDELSELLKLLCKSTDDIDLKIRNYSAEECIMEGDVNNLKQVFLNIFSNSVEELKGQTGVKKLLFEVDCDDEYVVFRIKDTGSGISDEIRERIYEPFFTTKETGTGLGLTITAKIIKDHDGILQIENDNGAHFIIKFKRVSDEYTSH